MDTALQYFPQDYNNTILAQTNVSGDTNGTYMDFNVAGSCPEGHIVIEVGTVPTSKTLNVELYESSDRFASNNTATLHKIVGISAAGTYFIPVDNRVVKKRSFRPVFKPQSLGTGQVIPIKSYFNPKRP